MLRAVEILAGLYERSHEVPQTPPVASSRPIVLFNETITLDVNATKREDVERALDIAFAYPARGWHTYCTHGTTGKREFLSLFYSANQLVSAELYYPKAQYAPKLEPVDLRFRLSPGEIALGRPIGELQEHFARFSRAAEHLGAFSDMFQARFRGGAAYAMGNSGYCERLAIYVLRNDPPPATS